jgi:hypothetical protein
MPSCDGFGGRYVLADGSIPGGFGQELALGQAQLLVLEDGVLGGRLQAQTKNPAEICGRPQQTVSQSEAGFEKIMQATESVLVAGSSPAMPAACTLHRRIAIDHRNQQTMPGTRLSARSQSRDSARLARLDELANNLWYSWDRPTRSLFARLSAGLWRAVHHSPKAFLKRMDQKRINEAADDPVFLGTMNRVLSAYDSYHAEPSMQLPGKPPLQADDLIAYFCAEFGFHESLPIYSGGLGILAGDHCKGASTCACPSSPSACSTARAISTRPSTATATRPRITATTISTTCRSNPCAAADGRNCASASTFPGARCGPRSGAPGSATTASTCSTPSWPRNSEADRAKPIAMTTPQRRLAHSRQRFRRHLPLSLATDRSCRKPDGLRHQRRPSADFPRPGMV